MPVSTGLAHQFPEEPAASADDDAILGRQGAERASPLPNAWARYFGTLTSFLQAGLQPSPLLLFASSHSS
jgi:hypothetical protein